MGQNILINQIILSLNVQNKLCAEIFFFLGGGACWLPRFVACHGEVKDQGFESQKARNSLLGQLSLPRNMEMEYHRAAARNTKFELIGKIIKPNIETQLIKSVRFAQKLL